MICSIEKIQALFEPFDRSGSTLTHSGGGHDPTLLDIIDGNIVTRVSGDQFWIHFKAMGYHCGFHHAHSDKILDWSQDDTWQLDPVHDQGRQLHIEPIFPEIEEAVGANWQKWQEYKSKNRKRIETDRRGVTDLSCTVSENW